MRRGFDVRPSDVDAIDGRKFLTRAGSRFLRVGVWIVLIFQAGCSEPALTPEDLSWASEDLTAVAVLNESEALVASRAGSIYRTNDAGEAYRRVHADPLAPLFDLSMFDENVGWAVGDGMILATRNGGRNWRVQPLPEGRELAELRSVEAVDENLVLAVGRRGIRLRTTTGGRLWEDRSDEVRVEIVGASASSPSAPRSGPSLVPAEVSFDADLYDVACDLGGDHCVSFGAARGVAYSIDRGQTWVASMRAPSLPFEPIELSEGSAELSPESIDRILDLVARLDGRSDVSIRVEAVPSGGEIESVSGQRSPESLFEILDARALDAAGALETAGLAAERISIRGAPPWGYEELLDDDPEYLDRYWSVRESATPGVWIFVVDERPMYGGGFAATSGVEPSGEVQPILAVGAAGAIWRSLDGGASWSTGHEEGEADLFALANDSAGCVVVGDQGSLRASLDVGESWREHTWTETMTVQGRLLDLDFSTNSGLGLIVGRAGVILKRDAGGAAWKRIKASSP